MLRIHHLAVPAVAAAVSLSLVGCSGKSKTSATPSPSSTSTAQASTQPSADPSPPAGAITAAQARAAILKPANLPGTYRIDSEGVDQHADDPVGCKVFDDFHLGDLKAHMVAAINLSAGDQGPFATEEISIHTVAEAQSLMARFKAITSQCGAFTTKDQNNNDLHWSAGPLIIPEEGDDHAAFRAKVTQSTDPSSFDITMTRVDGNLVFVTEGRTRGEVPSTPTLVAKAVAKVKQAAKA